MIETLNDTRIASGERDTTATPRLDKRYSALLRSSASRSLFRNLDSEFFIRFGNEPFTLLLTSPGSVTGRTLMSLMLSVSYAEQTATASSDTNRVLLIDCTRSFDSVKALGINPVGGFSLTDVRSETASEMSVQSTSIPGLDLCQVFSPDDEYKALPHLLLERLKRDVCPQYQRVFIDSEPASNGRDYGVLANIFHNVVIVTRYGQTRKQSLMAQVEHLEQLPCNILGSVINRRQLVLPQWLYGGQ